VQRHDRALGKADQQAVAGITDSAFKEGEHAA
jgi:hypothetical protein